MEEKSTEKQVQQLKAELAHKDNDLVLAAEIGKKLLEQNQDLEDRCEQLAEDHIKRIEQLEQDKYSLQMRLSAKEQVNRSQAAEMESLRESLHVEQEAARARERLEMAHAKQMQKMTGRVEELQTSLERAAMTEEQLRKKIEQHDELLKDAHSKLTSLELAPGKDDEQVYSLQHELATVKSDKNIICMELKDTNDQCQQLAFTVEVQKQQLQSLQNSIEEREQQITSYYNLLEKTREEVAEVQMQLEIAKMEATDVNKKGNSLFAEVEDRRKEAENKMISLKVQYESAKEQLNMKKQQVHKMRFQIAALLQMGGGRADSSQRERLEQSLAQSRSEVHMLTEKIKMLEKTKVSEGMGHQYAEYQKLLSESDKPDLVEFLQHKLKMAKVETEAIKNELHTQQLLQIAASDKLMDCERRLYSAETETDRTRAANMKLLVTLDELKLKLNVKDNGSAKLKISTGYREKICLKKPNGNKKVSDCNTNIPDAEDSTKRPTKDDESASQSLEVTSDDGTKVTAPDQTTQVSDDVTPALNNRQEDVNNRWCRNDILKPANRNQPLMTTGLPAKKQPKKSVSMCETVSVRDASGQTEVKQTHLKLGEEDGKKRSRETEDVDPLEEEKCEPGMGNGREGRSGGARHGGKKHYKVVHMKSNNAAECKQQ